MTTPAEAAGLVAGSLKEGAAGDLSPFEAVKKYPSPMDFQGDPWALKINQMLDSLDLPPVDALFRDPASSLMVGECARATGATFGGTGGNVHPGVLLTVSLVAYAAVVAVHRFAPKKPDEVVTQPAGENRFAGLA